MAQASNQNEYVLLRVQPGNRIPEKLTSKISRQLSLRQSKPVNPISSNQNSVQAHERLAISGQCCVVNLSSIFLLKMLIIIFLALSNTIMLIPHLHKLINFL
jgi:hypothetical protein